MTHSAEFDDRITKPLQAVLGKRLISVFFWIVSSDKAIFDPEKPNSTGLVAVRLCFDGSSVDTVSAWQEALKGEGNSHHIQFSHKEAWLDKGKKSIESICVSQNLLWSKLVDQTLTDISVYGAASNPQAVVMQFGEPSVALTIGYAGDNLIEDTGDEMLIGDGDDVLVLSLTEWQHHVASKYRKDWESLLTLRT